jgi:hypothetical protein
MDKMAGATGVPRSRKFKGLHWQRSLNATIDPKKQFGALATARVRDLGAHQFHHDDEGLALSGEASLSNFKPTARLRRKRIQDARHTHHIG